MTDWIDRTESLLEFVSHAPAAFGVDTEFMRVNTFFPRLALVQLAFAERVALIDPLAATDLDALGAVLADPARTVVTHSASEDLEALATRLPRGIAQLFDTQIAAAFAGLGAGLGYQKLVREILGIELPKAETRSDWLRRPLSQQQIEYAAHDVIHLPSLQVTLAERVAQRGYTAWLAADCARLLERARQREPDMQPQIALRGAADWPLERQALLRRVLIWRDATARRTDTPRPWILDDAAALDLSMRPPRDATELAERTKGLRGLRSGLRAELADLLRRPLVADELAFEPIPRAPSMAEKTALAALKDAVATRARELDLPEGLLCSRRHLETLLVTSPLAVDARRMAARCAARCVGSAAAMTASRVNWVPGDAIAKRQSNARRAARALRVVAAVREVVTRGSDRIRARQRRQRRRRFRHPRPHDCGTWRSRHGAPHRRSRRAYRSPCAARVRRCRRWPNAIPPELH